jgi:hypothetical protein
MKQEPAKPQCFGQIFEQEQMDGVSIDGKLVKEKGICKLCYWFTKCCCSQQYITKEQLKQLEKIAAERNNVYSI